MKKLIVVPISIMIAACGSDIPTVHTNPDLSYAQDAELSPYFKRFEADTGLSTEFIQAEFATLASGMAGLCNVSKQAPKGNLIKIDKAKWNNFSDTQREQVIYHELGHCLLLQFHRSDAIAPCPSSLMYPKVLDEKCYSEHKAIYVNELINNVNKQDQAVFIFIASQIKD